MGGRAVVRGTCRGTGDVPWYGGRAVVRGTCRGAVEDHSLPMAKRCVTWGRGGTCRGTCQGTCQGTRQGMCQGTWPFAEIRVGEARLTASRRRLQRDGGDYREAAKFTDITAESQRGGEACRDGGRAGDRHGRRRDMAGRKGA
jgi:hypothetical protein